MSVSLDGFIEGSDRDIVPDEVRALKAEPGGDLVVGGPRIAAQLLRRDLIDVVQMYVNPVVIGAGTPMFPAGVARVKSRSPLTGTVP
jgi:dihydrofolate reductase